jgi:hypothetical protein
VTYNVSSDPGVLANVRYQRSLSARVLQKQNQMPGGTKPE